MRQKYHLHTRSSSPVHGSFDGQFLTFGYALYLKGTEFPMVRITLEQRETIRSLRSPKWSWSVRFLCAFVKKASLIPFAEGGGTLAGFALEVAAEGLLLVEAQHVGDGLDSEVGAGVQQHLSF